MRNRRRNPIRHQVRTIRKALASIERTLARLVAVTNGDGRGVASSTGQARRRLKLSPARRAALEIQGRYMGSLRPLKPRQKARVKELRARKGLPAAIALAKRLARR